MIAMLLGVFGSIVAGVVGFFTAKAKANSPEAKAAADLNEAKAADLLIRNLSTQYSTTLQRLDLVERRLDIMERRFAMARGVVEGLPEEHRVKFDPVFAPVEVKGV